jgi:hypothetical protein
VNHAPPSVQAGTIVTRTLRALSLIAGACILTAPSTLAAPRAQNAPEWHTRHPAARYVVNSDAPLHFVSLSDSVGGRDRVSSHLSSIARALASSRATAHFGTDEGPIETVFGQIQSVAAGSAGVFVLDSRFNNVRRFTTDGRLVEVIGRAGNGPGEFSRPLSLTLDSRRRLYVSDLSRRVQRFRQGADGSYVYESTLQLPAAAVAMCFIGDDLIVHGHNFEVREILHRVDSNGTLLSSFGSVYASPTPIVNYQLSRGFIACDSDAGIVAHVPGGLPEVRAYTALGEPVWRLRLAGYRPIRFEEGTGGATRMGPPPGGYHSVTGVSAWGGVFVLSLQFTAVDSRWSSRTAARPVVVIDSREGHGTLLNRWQQSVAAMHPAGFVTTLDTPTVAVRFWTLGR